LLADLDGLEADITDRSCALLHRLRGEIAEIDGDFPAALAYWQEALALDSQVGIKRRYEALLSKVES
jgi:hypothetical protein